MRRVLGTFVVVAAVVACSGGERGSAGPDSGPRDAGESDGGTDAGPPDTGPADTGPADTGPADTGPPDAGSTDAGRLDASQQDAGCAADCPGADVAMIRASWMPCADGLHVGQLMPTPGVTCAQVCCAFCFTGCIHRAAQADFSACEPALPPMSGTCSDVFAPAWSSQCLCAP